MRSSRAQLLGALRTPVRIVEADVTDVAARERIVAEVEAWGGLDVLVNNAGLGGIGRFDESDAARMADIMEVNFFAPVELTRLLLPHLLRGRDPAIVNVSSVLALAAVPLKSEYCASKFALHGWSEALRMELAAEGVSVLEAQPSTTASEFFEHVRGDPSAQRSVGGHDT